MQNLNFNFNQQLSRDEYCDLIVSDLDNIINIIQRCKHPSELNFIINQIDWTWRYFEKIERLDVMDALKNE